MLKRILSLYSTCCFLMISCSSVDFSNQKAIAKTGINNGAYYTILSFSPTQKQLDSRNKTNLNLLREMAIIHSRDNRAIEILLFPKELNNSSESLNRAKLIKNYFYSNLNVKLPINTILLINTVDFTKNISSKSTSYKKVYENINPIHSYDDADLASFEEDHNFKVLVLINYE